MDMMQAVILALIQGVTEFLPISSSAHLILPSQLLGWPDQGLAFDVAVHFGSLLAVVVYFRDDLRRMIAAWLKSVSGSVSPQEKDDARLLWMVAVATLPAAIAGLLLGDLVEEHLRSTLVIAMATIVFGLLLGLAEYRSRRQQEVIQLGWTIALIIGCSQALALIPGTSRSGVTITTAVLLGLSRTAAARFSFLLSIPIIAAAGGLELTKLISTRPVFSANELLAGLLVSAASAYLCIGLFLRLLEKIGFMPFVWYRLGLGAVLLLMI